MSNCRICGAKASFIKQVEGYKKGMNYNISYCHSCDNSFSDCYPQDSDIYNLIYKSSSFIDGYKRYDTYRQNVLANSSPFSYLSEVEDMYWAIKKTMELSYLNKTDKILEVGCGMGYLTYSLYKEGFNIKGCDISEVAIEKAKQTYSSIEKDRYFVGDIFEMSLNNNEFYDTIILTEVIEHIFEPLVFIKALLKLLKPNGHIIITTPNKSSYNKNIIWTSDLPPIHYSFLSENSFKKIASLTDSNAVFIDFTDYNNKNHNFVDSSKVKDGISTFTSNGEVILKDQSFMMFIKKILKKTWIFIIIKYLNFILANNKDLTRSNVLCCVLKKQEEILYA